MSGFSSQITDNFRILNFESLINVSLKLVSGDLLNYAHITISGFKPWGLIRSKTCVALGDESVSGWSDEVESLGVIYHPEVD